MQSSQVNIDLEISFRRKLGTILLMAAIFFINFSSRVIMGPMMPTVEADLGLNHSQAGSIFLMISIGYFSSMAGSCFISSRLGHRRTVLGSAFSLGLVLILLAFCHSLPLMSLTLIVVGLTTGIYLPSAIATITGLINNRNWGKAMAVHEMAPNMGFILSPVLAELFIYFWTWRAVPAALGILSILTGLLFIVFGHGSDSLGHAPSAALYKTLLRQRSLWILVVLFSLAVAGFLGMYSMLPLALVMENGMDRGTANTIMAFSRTSGVFMAIASGWAADRLGPKRAMAIILGGSGACTILVGCLSGLWLMVFIFIQAALAAGFFPAGLSALSRIGAPEDRDTIVSIVIPLGFIVGGGAFPTMIGYMGETVSFSAGIILTGLLILIGPILVKMLKFKDSKTL